MKRLAQASMLAASIASCGFGAPTCGAGEVAVEGTLGGSAVSIRQSGMTAYLFRNFGVGGALGDLDIQFNGGANLHVAFPQIIPNGGSGPARGSVNLTAGAGIDVGNCETDVAFPSTLVLEQGSSGIFLLRGGKTGPSPYCGGMAQTGELAGCFRAMN
jgi:hypothetical protein